MLWTFGSVYNAARQLADHAQPVRYEMRPPPAIGRRPTKAELYVHRPPARAAHTA
jgi:magnesium-protoporphyrin IX monomethyl ester (oxidative) cyclase